MNPVQHPNGLVLGETSQDEASEFPVVSSMQRPVLLRLAEVPILLCSLTDQARDLKRGGPGQGLPFKSTGGDSSGAWLCATVRHYNERRTRPDRRLNVGPGEGIANNNGSPRNPNGCIAVTQGPATAASIS
jgi:hypothetical protein